MVDDELKEADVVIHPKERDGRQREGGPDPDALPPSIAELLARERRQREIADMASGRIKPGPEPGLSRGMRNALIFVLLIWALISIWWWWG